MNHLTNEQLIDMRDNSCVELNTGNIELSIIEAVTNKKLLHLGGSDYLSFNENGWMPVFFQDYKGSIQPVMYTVTSTVIGWEQNDTVSYTNGSDAIESVFIPFIPMVDAYDIEYVIPFSELKRQMALCEELSMFNSQELNDDSFIKLAESIKEHYGNH